jgi:hypothetical protein
MTLERLKELSQQATPGPWEVNPDGAEEWWYNDTILGEGGGGGALASCIKGNASLIVTAINALPLLLEVAEAARAVNGWDIEWFVKREYCEDGKAIRAALKNLEAALAKLEKEG